MIVRDYMTSPVVTVPPNITIQNALKMMHTHQFQRLPVVDDKNKLIGIVTERDLLYASPMPISAINVWNTSMMIEDLMTKEVIVISENETLEVAARLMLDNMIEALPVVDNIEETSEPQVVGIITKSDILKAFLKRHKSRADMDVFIVGETKVDRQ